MLPLPSGRHADYGGGPADDTTREMLGLTVAARLVERGLCEITKSNRFILPGQRRR